MIKYDKFNVQNYHGISWESFKKLIKRLFYSIHSPFLLCQLFSFRHNTNITHSHTFVFALCLSEKSWLSFKMLFTIPHRSTSFFVFVLVIHLATVTFVNATPIIWDPNDHPQTQTNNWWVAPTTPWWKNCGYNGGSCKWVTRFCQIYLKLWVTWQ